MSYGECRQLIDAINQSEAIGFDTESAGPNLTGDKFLNIYKSSMAGFSVATLEDDTIKTYYVPVGHRSGNLATQWAIELLQAVITHKEVWVHNWKWDYQVLRLFLGDINKIPGGRDSMILSWLLGDSSTKRNGGLGLKPMAKRKLGLDMISFEETAQGKQFSQLTPHQAKSYAGRDAAATLAIGLLDKPKADWVWSHFVEIEMPFVFLLAEIQERGIGLDYDGIMGVYNKYTPRLKELRAQWYALNRECSITSPKQISDHLFEAGIWSTDGVPRTENGWSSSKAYVEQQLTALPEGSTGYKLAQIKLDFSIIQKLLSTYTLGLIDHAYQNPDRRLHPSFNHTGTITGRLSSSKPNAQNLPARADIGKEILGCLVPAKDKYLVSADFSQIELRVLSHYAECGLTEAYRQGRDVHQQTADVVGCSRQQGKTLNFAVIYGAGPGRVSSLLSVDKEDAKDFLDAYWRAYPEIKTFQDKVLSTAHERGWLKTLAGRRGYFPEYTRMSLRGFSKEKARVERQAFNLLIQGGAADICKAAMLACRDSGLRIVSQIHDDIIIETDDPERDAPILKRCMESAWPGLKVPLVAEPSIGKSMKDLK